MKRYLVFLILVWICVFGINKSLSFFSWNNYINSFFGIQEQSYFLKQSSTNTLKEIKQEVMYSSLDTILKKKQEENKEVYRFQFSLWDLADAYESNKEAFKDNEPFKAWFKEFWNILNSIRGFEKSKLLNQTGWYEAKKVFKIKKDTFSFAFDYLYKNKEYQIKFYDVQFANKNIYKTDIQKILDKSYVIVANKKTVILYNKKENKKEELVRYTIKTDKIVHQFPNTVNKEFINFFTYFTESFAKRSINYSVKKRNIWIVYPPIDATAQE